MQSFHTSDKMKDTFPRNQSILIALSFPVRAIRKFQNTFKKQNKTNQFLVDIVIQKIDKVEAQVELSYCEQDEVFKQVDSCKLNDLFFDDYQKSLYSSDFN